METQQINKRIEVLEQEVRTIEKFMQTTSNVSPNVIAIKQRAVIEKNAELTGLKALLKQP
jgi:hypothetical protein